MIQFHLPPPHLRTWVESLVSLDVGPDMASSKFPALTSAMLVVRLRGDVRRGGAWGAPVPPAAWIEASTGPQLYAHPHGVHAVGLVLPASVSVAFRRPTGRAIASVNRVLDARQVVVQGWSEAEAAVRAAVSDPERFAVLFRFVERCVVRWSRAPELAWRLALLEALVDGVSFAGRHVGLGHRQFERRFRAAFGMSAKQHLTIERLRSTLVQGMAEPTSLANLAVEQGFFDQAHLARDARRLLGAPVSRVLGRQRNLDQLRAGPFWPLSGPLRADRQAK